MKLTDQNASIAAGVQPDMLLPATRTVTVTMSALAWELLEQLGTLDKMPLELFMADQLDAWATEKVVQARVLRDAYQEVREAPPRCGGFPYRSKRLYFIQRGAEGPIKIGVSNEPTRRRANLQNGSAEKVFLLLEISQSDDVNERSVHKKFHHCRKEGEWFAPHPELLTFIEQQRKRAFRVVRPAA